MKNFLSLEISGVEDVLDRYINPINKETFLEIFDFFIKKEYTEVFNFINNIIDFEQSIEQTDITLSLCKTTAREALMLIKKEYGIVLDIEEDEFRANDILNILSKLEFLTDIDRDRAWEFLEILNSEDTELEAITSIMIEIGFDEFFLLEKLEKIEYGYLNQYKDFLNRIIGDAEDDISKTSLDEINLVKNTISKINNLSNTLLSKELNYKIKCIDIAEARQSFVMTKSMLAELNTMDFKTLSNNEIALEFLAAILLTNLRNEDSLINTYRDTIVLGLELGLKREEDIYKILSEHYTKITEELRYESKRAV